MALVSDPGFLCLMVVGLDTARLACGQASVFSPVGLFGLIGVQFFFGAPLLHVYLDYWMNYTVGPADWRPWLGGMAWLNLAGLIAFRIGRHVGARGSRPPARRELHPARFYGLGGALLIVAALAQLLALPERGRHRRLHRRLRAGQALRPRRRSRHGPRDDGRRDLPDRRLHDVRGRDQSARHVRRRGRDDRRVRVLLALCLCSAACAAPQQHRLGDLLGGEVTHCWLRPARPTLAGRRRASWSFMYGYGLYKGVRGAEGLSDLWQGRVSLSELEQRTEKPLGKVLLTDFGRGDIQALILQRSPPALSSPWPDAPTSPRSRRSCRARCGPTGRPTSCSRARSCVSARAPTAPATSRTTSTGSPARR